MVTWVLDTSVVVKWFLAEEQSDPALIYLNRLTSGDARVAAPSSLPYELANVFWVRRRDGLSAKESAEMWEDFSLLPLSLADGFELLPRALTLAHEHEVSPYDAAFVALAEELGCDFVTADRKLWRRLNEAHPRVKLL